MREFLSVEREANAIRLRRSTFPGAFLLVEGSTDKTFYERFVHKNTCAIVSPSGKPSSKLRVIEVLTILEQASFPGILAIVDADFDHLEGLSHNNPNLIITDTHDLETMLLNSPALDKVMAEFGSAEKIAKFGQDVKTVLLEAGIIVGYLRWVSQIDGLNLTFSSIKFSNFINEKTLEADLSKLMQEVKNKSQIHLASKDLGERMAKQRSNFHDPWQVCCGHDLVEILALGLRKALGSAKASDVNTANLERSLRLAYEEIYFRTTQLYVSICRWETNNQSFKVLLNS